MIKIDQALEEIQVLNKITIIMYHYVRDLKNSNHPDIKGLDLENFKGQILFLKKYYNFISIFDLLEAKKRKKKLSNNSVLLTFDDGYIDHFVNVFPILAENNISGCFFPPAKCILENNVLDVNKIHYILASVREKKKIIEIIFENLNEYRKEYKLESNDFFWKKSAVANRYDNAEIKFIKNSLQRDLPYEFSKILVDKLFKEFVSKDEVGFSKKLYMNIKQLSELIENGMSIGAHGYEHLHLGSITRKRQEEEINLSIKFLEKIGIIKTERLICYPYGSYNQDTLDIVKKKNFRLGFTTKINISDLNNDDFLTLPRIDTTDLPTNRLSKKNEWTNLVL